MSALVPCIEHPLSVILRFFPPVFPPGTILGMACHLCDDVSLSLAVGKKAVVGAIMQLPVLMLPSTNIMVHHPNITPPSAPANLPTCTTLPISNIQVSSRKVIAASSSSPDTAVRSFSYYLIASYHFLDHCNIADLGSHS
jgi:hypothetical protein